jgi:hypothetical protein
VRVLDLYRRHLAGKERAEQRGFARNAVIENPYGSLMLRRFTTAEINRQVRRSAGCALRQRQFDHIQPIAQPRPFRAAHHSFELEQQIDRGGQWRLRAAAVQDAHVNARFPCQALGEFAMNASEPASIDPECDVADRAAFNPSDARSVSR